MNILKSFFSIGGNSFPISSNTFVQELLRYSLDELSSHINWYLMIQDPDLRKDFQVYSISRRSYLILLCFTLIFSFIIVPIHLIIIFEVHQLSKGELLGYSLIFFLLLLLLAIVSWGFILMKKYPIIQNYDRMLSTIFIVLSTVIVIMRLFRYLAIPNCELTPLEEVAIGRDCSQEKNTLAWDSGCYLIVPTLAYIIILKETRFHLIILSFLAVLGSMMYIVLRSYPFSFSFLCIWTLIDLVVIIEFHLENIRAFFLKRRLIETLVEKEQMDEHNQAHEMRHMIANVAHDLKTPLASFTSGLEFIGHILIELEECFQNQSVTVAIVHEKCLLINQSLEDIRSTNSFMLMTINRCIDYTKASKGIKLVPRYETIDLLETLRLPLNCMRNIQHRIQITLQPLSTSICSHIITDKQWLQENILCLLSNAVKYSSQGEVFIEIRLESSKDSDNSIALHNDLKLKLLIPKAISRHSSINVLSSISTFSFNRSALFGSIDNADLIRNDPIHLEDYKNEDSGLNTSFDANSQNSAIKNEESFTVLRFEVEDTGIGMTDEAMKTLFNPFKQTQRLAGGTGLGLYSLAKRIETLNGKYGVMNRRDGKQGSLFWFTIPYKPDEISAALYFKENPSLSPVIDYKRFSPLPILNSPQFNYLLSKEMGNSSSNLNLNNPKYDILIIDDSPSILKMTSMMLQRQGHEVHQAENGALAVKMVEEKWKETGKVYDLLLMDLQMPVMDGLEATRRIRQNEMTELDLINTTVSYGSPENFLSTIPPIKLRPRQIIVGCSANSDEETTREAVESGVDAFITKPFTIDTFRSIMKKYVIKYS